MFTISQIDRLRVFMYVDQKYASNVRVGDPVEVSLSTNPNEKFNAKVDMIAGELDPKTRTQLVEMIMDNHEQKIVAGSFVQVRLKMKSEPLLELPVQALVMQGNTPMVPLIVQGHTVHYVPVDLAENTGKQILLRSGIREGDPVALNVGVSLREGQRVRPVPSEKTVAGQPNPALEQGGTTAPSPTPSLSPSAPIPTAALTPPKEH